MIDLNAAYDHYADAQKSSLDNLLAAVTTYVYRVGKDPDVAQRTTIRIWKHIGDYDPTRAPFRVWVHLIMRSVRSHAIKRQQQDAATDSTDVYEDVPIVGSVPHVPTSDDLPSDATLQLIAALPQELAGAATAYLRTGSYALAARESGLTINQVRARMKKIRAFVAEHHTTS